MHVTGPREHAMPRGDMKDPRISAELKKMGAVR
jgi:hypothetical protein